MILWCLLLGWILDGLLLVFGLSLDRLLLGVLRLLLERGLFGLLFNTNQLCFFCLLFFPKGPCCFLGCVLLLSFVCQEFFYGETEPALGAGYGISGLLLLLLSEIDFIIILIQIEQLQVFLTSKKND